jgi:hypothetical protein
MIVQAFWRGSFSDERARAFDGAGDASVEVVVVAAVQLILVAGRRRPSSG